MNERALFGRRATLAIYAVLTVAVLLPVFSVPVPVLGDYLNHLARIHIMLDVDHSAALQRFYESHWHIVPYFGMDIPVLLLARLVGLLRAGQVFVAVCVMMPVLAAAVLRYAVWRRVGLVPILGFLLSYGYLLAMGFLPYEFSAGLAVMLFAGWIATEGWPRWRRAALFGVAAALVYLCHVFAFLAYGLLIGGYELARLMRRRERPAADMAKDFVAAGMQAAPTLILAITLRDQVTLGTAVSSHYSSLAGQAAALMMPLYFPGPVWLMLAFLMVPLAALLLAPWWQMPTAVWPALALTTLAACAVPHIMFNVWGADFRLPFVAGMVAAGIVARTPRLPRNLAYCIVVGVAGLVFARTAEAYVTLHGLARQLAELREVLAHMPPGKRLLVVEADSAAPQRLVPTMITGQMGLMAVIDRDAFVPYLFISVTAVQVRPALRDSASEIARAVTGAQLREGLAPAPAGHPPAVGDGGQKYWLGWPAKFDYALIMRFGADNGAVPAILQPVALNSTAGLYKIAGPEANR